MTCWSLEPTCSIPIAVQLCRPPVWAAHRPSETAGDQGRSLSKNKKKIKKKKKTKHTIKPPHPATPAPTTPPGPPPPAHTTPLLLVTPKKNIHHPPTNKQLIIIKYIYLPIPISSLFLLFASTTFVLTVLVYLYLSLLYIDSACPSATTPSLRQPPTLSLSVFFRYLYLDHTLIFHNEILRSLPTTSTCRRCAPQTHTTSTTRHADLSARLRSAGSA